MTASGGGGSIGDLAVPWAAAVATAVGSLPGTSSQGAASIVAGELPDFAHVPELPARGPGADMVGRTGGLLAGVASGLGMETTPQGWRFGGGLGREMRRAQSFLGEDLDALEEQLQEYAGPLKCQMAGPWTLAAAIELRTGERALRDPGAVADIAEALAHAVADHVADLRRRVPCASAIVVQVDEPGLPAVLAGRIGTASGLSSYRAVDEQAAERVLRGVLTAAGEAGAFGGVHCCAGDPPVDLLRRSGARFVSVDLTRSVAEQALDDPLGRAWEAGVGILAGVVPSTGAGDLRDSVASAPLRALLHRLGLEDTRWLGQVAVTPACGLAGASPQWARTALAACAAVGRVVRNDAPVEGGRE
ncbi:MAG: uroporphyrinogen decarboxylase/cobalamine-independent methonine synthase family protein [Candidatus Nanopelagicales bacterium]